MANYEHVNSAWPEQVPIPSDQEALAGARRLVRLALTLGPPGVPVRKFSGGFKITSGNRRTWTKSGVFQVNPNWYHGKVASFVGWQAIVHDVSHWAFNRMYNSRKLGHHPAQHAFIERTLAEHVVQSGWLDGKLKRPGSPKPLRNLRAERAARVAARLVKWEAKRKRAENEVRKLRRKVRYYESALSVQ